MFLNPGGRKPVPPQCFQDARLPGKKEKLIGTLKFWSQFHNSNDVFNFSVKKAPDLVNEILVQNNISIDDINYFIFHQANQIILETLGKKLKIPEDKLIIDISNTGNTVSSTIPIALSNALKSGKIKRGNRIMIAGFGVGFSWGGTILDI